MLCSRLTLLGNRRQLKSHRRQSLGSFLCQLPERTVSCPLTHLLRLIYFEMARCCCCVNIRTGALILGLLGLVLAVAELVPLVPYLGDWNGFNPIKENLQNFFYIFEQVLEEHKFEKVQIDAIISDIKLYLWSIVLGEAIAAGVYCFASLLLVFGVRCNKRGLMLPYLFIQVSLATCHCFQGVKLSGLDVMAPSPLNGTQV